MPDNNVSTAKPKIGGAIHRGPVTATLPTDATTALSGFTALGYVSQDGLANTWEINSGEIKAWGGATVYTYQDDVKDSFKFKLIESKNPEVLKTVYGEANVSGTLAAGLSVAANADETKEYAWVVEMIMAGNIAKRIVIPKGKITAVGDIVYKDNDTVAYDVTITAIQDSAGNTHYEYMKETT